MTSRNYQGKSIFITGASSGIGAAVATEIAKAGGRVALAARRLDRLETVRQQITDTGGTAIAVACDVTDRASVDSAVTKTIEMFGGIDIAIANAGFGVAGPFSALTTHDFRRQFDTNVFGVIDTIQAVLPHLLTSQGQLVLVSSVLGRVGMADTTAYCASKFAVYGLAESLYFELTPKGITVSCILPGIVASEIRLIDNFGHLDKHRTDPAPKTLIVPTHLAAHEIVRRLPSRHLELVITRHGKLIVWLSRHFPRTFRALSRQMSPKNAKARRQNNDS